MKHREELKLTKPESGIAQSLQQADEKQRKAILAAKETSNTSEELVQNLVQDHDFDLERFLKAPAKPTVSWF